MKQQNIKVIEKMVQAIAIQPDRSIVFGGKEYSSFFAGEEKTISGEMLYQNLQNLIYAEFYCKEEIQQRAEKPERDLHDTGAQRQFTEQLRNANQSMERWDRGWVVYSAEPNGAVLLQKANHLRTAYPGEFIKESFTHKRIEKEEQVRLLVRRESYTEGDGFYFALGTHLGEDQQQFLVRLYFNIRSEGAAHLMELVTGSFNKYQVPFQFKCLSDPAAYVRNDAAVLYLDKRYFRIASEILSRFYPELKKHLKDACPLFTKRITGGIAFAENPFNMNESFGTSRAKLIARGMMDAFNENAGKENWVDKITGNIEKHGFSLEQFYLNPNSCFEYHFPELD